MAYYDGTKLLSMKDWNGKDPEIFMVTSNRTGGKTTYFSRLLVNRFLKQQKKFMLVYRYVYELSECATQFFKDINSLFFSGHQLTSSCRGKGAYYELFMDGKPCGYAVSINSAEQVKKYSHVFSDVDSMFMDEFQSETGKYCSNEVNKLISIHTSVARGQGKQVRYVPLYMCANTVTLINPYFSALGISSRVRKDTKFVRGDGFVLECAFVESASRAQLESGFNRAFSQSNYVAYSAQNVYLNDNYAFIEQPEGPKRYVMTFKYEAKHYAIWEYAENGYMWVSNKADLTYPYKVCVTTEEHNINYVMLKKSDLMISNLRRFFELGCFRFKDLECKNALLQLLSY